MSKKVDRYKWQDLFASKYGPPNPVTRLVLFVIAMHLFKGKEKAFPGQSRIAEFAGLTTRSVSDHVGEAERLGWLRVVRIVGVRTEYHPAIPAKLIESSKTKAAHHPPATPEPHSGVSLDHPGTTFRGNPGTSRQSPLNVVPVTPEPRSTESSSETCIETSIQTSPALAPLSVLENSHSVVRAANPEVCVLKNGSAKAEENTKPATARKSKMRSPSRIPELRQPIEAIETREAKATTLMRAVPDMPVSKIASTYSLTEQRVIELRAAATATETTR